MDELHIIPEWEAEVPIETEALKETETLKIFLPSAAGTTTIPADARIAVQDIRLALLTRLMSTILMLSLLHRNTIKQRKQTISMSPRMIHIIRTINTLLNKIKMVGTDPNRKTR